jgi:hypothetical protein
VISCGLFDWDFLRMGYIFIDTANRFISMIMVGNNYIYMCDIDEDISFGYFCQQFFPEVNSYLQPVGRAVAVYALLCKVLSNPFAIWLLVLSINKKSGRFPPALMSIMIFAGTCG